jgi:hypothetical protein
MFCQVRCGRIVSSAVMLCLSSLEACAVETDGNSDLALSESALQQQKGGYDSAAAPCVPKDASDTLPDQIDEDCDGKIDEDADATRASCPWGTRIIEGTRGDDLLRGTRGRDCILGYGGNDTIYGESGDDLLFGGPGDDVIFTGSGKAIVHAGSGADRVDTSGGFASTVYGGGGEDTLIGGPGLDLFYGGADNDVLNGGGGHDLLHGGDCHDLLIGGHSFDLVKGGSDYDVCEGEFAAECEKSNRNKVTCQRDSDCYDGGRCARSSGFCVPAGAAACGGGGPSGCTPSAAQDTSCNGVDDDCDGVADDDYAAQTTECGAGSCSATGTTACMNGQVQDSCRSGTPLPGGDTSCDARDDDCDGRVDEGFASSPTRCGVGECAGSGRTACVNGSVIDDCAPAAPGSATDASCDGRDDDCDGQLDDDYVSVPTSCGSGGCGATGTTSCVDGAVVDSCIPDGPSLPSDDICNGVDDDCDGAIDDDFVPTATSCGLGVCANRGNTRCSGGVLSDSCTPRSPNASRDETCNGRDDDCDGPVDEEYEGFVTTCGFGECASEGRMTCAAGRLIDTCQVPCEGECNDGVEDDSDGVIDCADPDCDNEVGCLEGSFGSSCVADSDCDRVGSEGFCVTGVPGGYCSRPCGVACPSGTFCIGGVACVVQCGRGDNCGREGFECGAVPIPGLPLDPWCHPTCMLSCPEGTTCNAATDVCDAMEPGLE